MVTKEGEPGDILMSVRAPVGPINEATQRICIGRGLAAIRARDGLDRDFLWYALLWLQPMIKGSAGAVFDSINKAGIESLPIPLPPLEEQKRIVAILDEAFEGLDRARAHAEANLQNARELFESALDYEFENANQAFEARLVSTICDSIVDCLNRTAPKVDHPTPYKMIRTTNIRYGKLDLSDVKYVDEETYKIWTRRQVPMVGDVLLTREAPLGETAIIENDDTLFLGQRIVSYRVKPDVALPRYLYFALRSRLLKKQFKDFGAGATVQHMRVPQSKELLIPVPPIETQKAIIQILDSVENEVHSLEAAFECKLQDIDDLRQSLLQKAFEGELTGREAA